MRTLLLIFALAITVSAQGVLVGTLDNVMYSVDEVQRKGDKVKFLGSGYGFYVEDGKTVLDLYNYKIISFEASCKTYRWQQFSYVGKDDGDEIRGTYPNALIHTASEGDMMFKALDVICKSESKCNVFDARSTRSCCVEHDTAYQLGGQFVDRFKADNRLFKCLWKKNKVAAIFMYTGVRLFGTYYFKWRKTND